MPQEDDCQELPEIQISFFQALEEQLLLWKWPVKVKAKHSKHLKTRHWNSGTIRKPKKIDVHISNGLKDNHSRTGQIVPF